MNAIAFVEQRIDGSSEQHQAYEHEKPADGPGGMGKDSAFRRNFFSKMEAGEGKASHSGHTEQNHTQHQRVVRGHSGQRRAQNRDSRGTEQSMTQGKHPWSIHVAQYVRGEHDSAEGSCGEDDDSDDDHGDIMMGSASGAAHKRYTSLGPRRNANSFPGDITFVEKRTGSGVAGIDVGWASGGDWFDVGSGRMSSDGSCFSVRKDGFVIQNTLG